MTSSPSLDGRVTVERVDLTDDGRCAAIVRLNRPDQLNAITWDMHRAIAEHLRALEKDGSVRAVLITGSGRAFSAGGDIKAYKKLQADDTAFTHFVDDFCDLLTDMRAMSKPVIALVNGICAAGGLELMLGCDFAWAAEGARIGDMHLNFAQVGGGGVMARLPRLTGSARALELVLSGKMIDAEQALAWGVVSRVVADDRLLEEGIEFARSVAAKSPRAVHYVKKTIHQGVDVDLPAALQLERGNALEYCLTYPDSMEGIQAFIEKREPRFEAL